MRSHHAEDGFTLLEMLAATAIGLMVIATALTTFKDAVGMANTASDVADTTQNLRGGANFLIHDLTLAGRGIPIGGIPIPSGPGAGQILRPSPPGLGYTFDNVAATTMTAITSGSSLGPQIDGQATDMVTLLSVDPILDACLGAPLSVKAAGTGAGQPELAADGSSLTIVNTNIVRCPDGNGGWDGGWLAGNSSQPPVKKGDLLLFTDPNGRNAIQTVTSTDNTTVFFAQNADDTFGFNQPAVAAGSIAPLLGQALSVQRVLMYTYYVDPNNGTPRLMRRYNMGTPQALAGVVEDLQLSYDLVDGVVNPTNVTDVPYTLNGVTYSANQIRKVSLHIGVRSETMSLKLHDYLRNHLSTVVSIRNLAFVDRYQ
jgi:prepilin-type N-terminal cleavage/methylation domain-containing protein